MLLELNQVGKREMLLNLIARIDAKRTPVQSIAPKSKETLSNMLVEWQNDNFEDPAQEMAWPDGKDVESFSNASPDRGMVRTYAMKILDSAMVSDLAEEVSDVAGLAKGELAESVMKKLKRLSRAIECFMCSDLDTQEQAGDTPYRSRGLGSWINNSAQTTLPVPSAYRTPAASINATAVASLTEDDVNDVLQSMWEQSGETEDLQLVAGATLRRQFTSFGTRISAATTSAPVVRSYTTAFTGKLDNVVTQYNGDFGQVNIIPTHYNAHPAFDGSTTINPLRGYLFPTNALQMAVKRMPRVKKLEDRGGGERFLVDWVGAWWVKNALSCGAFKATAAS